MVYSKWQPTIQTKNQMIGAIPKPEVDSFRHPMVPVFKGLVFGCSL
jgi:hypothetical protein